MSSLVSKHHQSTSYYNTSDWRISVSRSRFSLVPESERNRPRAQAHEEDTYANSPLPSIPNPLGEHGVGGVLNNVFHNISRFFTGGNEEHPPGQDDNTNNPAEQRQENHPTARSDSAASASHPPGAFPRPVSPTVDDHPDHPINTRSNATDDSHVTLNPTNQPVNPFDRARTPEHASPDHEDVRDMDRPQQTASADNSASRFLSNLFEQRGGSPLSGTSNPRSPGPMGTASYFGRTSSPPQFLRNTSNPPSGPNRVIPDASASEQPADASLITSQSDSQEKKNSVQPPAVSPSIISERRDTASTEETSPNSEQNKPEQHPQQNSHEPIYPTLIPAEYRERQARREAMIREQEERSERSQGHPTDEHAVSA